MNTRKRIIIAAIAVAAIVIGAVSYALLTGSNTVAPEAENHDASRKQPDTENAASVITYDGSSFTVSEATVSSGATVKVTNDSSEPLEFDSDPHPVHTDNTELNEGNIPPGESATFVLEEKGTWGFHNHLDASRRGTITVE